MDAYGLLDETPLDLNSLLHKLQGQVSSQWYLFGLAIGVPIDVLKQFIHYSEQDCLVEPLDYILAKASSRSANVAGGSQSSQLNLPTITMVCGIRCIHTNCYNYSMCTTLFTSFHWQIPWKHLMRLMLSLLKIPHHQNPQGIEEVSTVTPVPLSTAIVSSFSEDQGEIQLFLCNPWKKIIFFVAVVHPNHNLGIWHCIHLR